MDNKSDEKLLITQATIESNRKNSDDKMRNLIEYLTENTLISPIIYIMTHLPLIMIIHALSYLLAQSHWFQMFMV